MSRRHFAIATFLALIFALTATAQSPATNAPPRTRTDNVKEVLHGAEIVDPYRWLEEQNSPETRAWIDAQNVRTRALFDALPGRASLVKRLSELLRVDSVGVPSEKGGRYFFTKRAANQDLSVLYVRKGLKGQDEVLIDPHGLSADKTTSVSFAFLSDDGKTMAYRVRQGGEDETPIHFMDVDTKKDLADRLPRARYSGVAMTRDKKRVFYSKNTPEGPRVYVHEMGAGTAADKEIFGAGYGPGKIIGCDISEDGRYLVIHVLHGSAASKTEIYYQELGNSSPIKTLVNDVEARFFADFVRDRAYLLTNWNAPNSRLLAADLKSPERANWREIVPEKKSPLQSVTAAAGRLFARYLENASTRLTVFDKDGKPLRDVPLPAIGTAGFLSGRWDSNELFYTFTSFHMPTTVYRHDAARNTTEVFFRLQVPIRSEEFQVKQVWYPSKDGTRIPMFLVHREGLKLDGKRPVYLTGYGGFTSSQTPSFSATAALWVERGGVYALPNLRGGGEFGEEWHKAGMLDRKQNVFDDFIGAAEWLIKNNYTNPSKIAIAGSSNGGLLVGAAVTQRPELFGAVLCGYPLLDMVRYHKFLVARYWVPEYGSADDPKQFPYLHAYSPYHRVKAGTKYPAVLIYSGDADTRVDPLHARKMAALMQASTGSDKPVVLFYDTKAGHSGGKPLSKIIEDQADMMNFVVNALDE